MQAEDEQRGGHGWVDNRWSCPRRIRNYRDYHSIRESILSKSRDVPPSGTARKRLCEMESWIDIQQAGDGRRGAAVMAAAAAALAARAARG